MRRATVVIALTAATAVAGCGSSSSTLSKGDLIAKGDAICKRVNTNIKNVGPTTTAAQIATVAPKVQQIEQQGVSDLKGLKAPASVAKDWGTFLQKVQQLTDDAGKIGIAAKNNNRAQAQQVATEASGISGQATGIAQKLGFKECSKQS